MRPSCRFKIPYLSPRATTMQPDRFEIIYWSSKLMAWMTPIPLAIDISPFVGLLTRLAHGPWSNKFVASLIMALAESFPSTCGINEPPLAFFQKWIPKVLKKMAGIGGGQEVSTKSRRRNPENLNEATRYHGIQCIATDIWQFFHRDWKEDSGVGLITAGVMQRGTGQKGEEGDRYLFILLLCSWMRLAARA